VDDRTLGFVRSQAANARVIASVCTGALLLGAAGLLNGRKATTHWMSLHFLPLFGAIVPRDDAEAHNITTSEHLADRLEEEEEEIILAPRVVVDGNIITGGGVTAGIDFGLRLVEQLAGEETARSIQLAIEYDPRPPFPGGGHPRSETSRIVRSVREGSRARLESRRACVLSAVAAASSKHWLQPPTISPSLSRK